MGDGSDAGLDGDEANLFAAPPDRSRSGLLDRLDDIAHRLAAAAVAEPRLTRIEAALAEGDADRAGWVGRLADLDRRTQGALRMQDELIEALLSERDRLDDDLAALAARVGAQEGAVAAMAAREPAWAAQGAALLGALDGTAACLAEVLGQAEHGALDRLPSRGLVIGALRRLSEQVEGIEARLGPRTATPPAPAPRPSAVAAPIAWVPAVSAPAPEEKDDLPFEDALEAAILATLRHAPDAMARAA